MAHLDDGSMEFFQRDPLELFAELNDPVIAPLATDEGGATSVDAAGGTAGFFSDLVDGVTAAARRLANFATYYQMKEHSGTIGRTGVHAMLEQIRRHKPDIKLHLVSHSFGGRLATAAAEALAPNTTNVTLTLLQAAYSHNGIAEDFDGEHDGFYRKLITQKRISGPILITHTKNDQAVEIAYPLASRPAHQKAAAVIVMELDRKSPMPFCMSSEPFSQEKGRWGLWGQVYSSHKGAKRPSGSGPSARLTAS